SQAGRSASRHGRHGWDLLSGVGILDRPFQPAADDRAPDNRLKLRQYRKRRASQLARLFPDLSVGQLAPELVSENLRWALVRARGDQLQWSLCARGDQNDGRSTVRVVRPG